MKVFLVVIIFFSIFNCYSQQIKIDSFKRNSISHKNDSAKQCTNHSTLKSLLIPTALITYGFFTLETKGLKQLDKSTQLEITEDHPAFITKIDNYSTIFSGNCCVWFKCNWCKRKK